MIPLRFRIVDPGGLAINHHSVSKNQDRSHVWQVIVDPDLDKRARAAAKKSGKNLSQWIRDVVRQQLGMPTL